MPSFKLGQQFVDDLEKLGQSFGGRRPHHCLCGGLRIENSDRLAIALHPALQTVQLVAAIDEMVVVILVHSPTMRLENEGVAHPPEITPQNMADLDHFGRVVRDVASSRRILCPVR